MTPQSHPCAASLAGYATGWLPLAPGIAVAAHVETCRECAGRVAEIEETEGQRMLGSPPAPLPERMLEALLARIDAEGRRPPAKTIAATSTKIGEVDLPAAAARAGLGPRRRLAPGLWAAHIRTARQDGWRAFLLHAPAGFRIPTHRHRGAEMIAVLKGAFHDGRIYRAGDFAESPAGGSHDLRVGPEGACACLIAVEGRVRWRGWARVLAPVLGI